MTTGKQDKLLNLLKLDGLKIDTGPEDQEEIDFSILTDDELRAYVSIMDKLMADVEARKARAKLLGSGKG